MPKEYPRTARLNAQMQRELTSLIRDELSDPRIGMVTVTSVDVSPDMRNARVLVSSFGDDDSLKESIKGLKRAAGKLRGAVGRALGLRYTPELSFSADVALREGDRISGLIRAATANDAEAQKQRGESDLGADSGREPEG